MARETRQTAASPRYVPAQRVSIDGKVWWCVYDTREKCFSRNTYHGKYRNKSDAQWAIDYFGKKYGIK